MKLLQEAPAAERWNKEILANQKSATKTHENFLKTFRLEIPRFYSPEMDSQIPLRPVILTTKQSQEIHSVSKTLIRLCEEAIYLMTGGQPLKLCANFDIHPDAHPLFSNISVAKRAVSEYARPDFVISNGDVKFVEMNVHTAIGGVTLSSILPQLYLNSSSARTLRSEHSLCATSPLIQTANWLRDLSKRLDLRDPLVAFFEWEYEVEKIQWLANSLAGYGIRSIYVNPDEVELKDGYFYFNHLRIDIGLRCFSLKSLEFPEDTPKIKTFLEGHKSSGTLMLPCETASLVSHKSVLAFLSENACLFLPEDQKIIETYVPWTRVLSAGSDLAKVFGGRIQKDLVLKKSNGEQGSDVVIGCQSSADVWAKAVTDACRDGGWIIQEFCPPDFAELPFLENENIVFKNGPVVFGCFNIGDEEESAFLTRINFENKDLIVNFARGSVVGTAVIEG